MRVDWGDRWSALIPYSYGRDAEGNTHFLSMVAPSGSRRYAITQTVIEWAHYANESPPSRNQYEILHHHKDWRRRVWRRLYRRGFRVVKLKIRQAK